MPRARPKPERFFALLALLCMAWPAFAQPPLGSRIDGVAAMVGGASGGANVTIILRSDVDLRARIALRGRVDTAATQTDLPPDLLNATLDELVGEALIAREAERVRVRESEARDLEVERAQLVSLAGGQEGFDEVVRATHATPREITAMVTRRAQVTAFLEANLEGTTVVTDSQLLLAYESGEHPFVGRPLEEVETDLRAFLARRALERAVARWVTVLRARFPVRIVARY